MAEVMGRYVDKCNKLLRAYSTRDAAGGGGSSAGGMLALLPMPTTAMIGSMVHLRGPLAAAAVSTTARMTMVMSRKGEETSADGNADNSGHPSDASHTTPWNTLAGCKGVDGPSSIDKRTTVQEGWGGY